MDAASAVAAGAQRVQQQAIKTLQQKRKDSAKEDQSAEPAEPVEPIEPAEPVESSGSAIPEPSTPLETSKAPEPLEPSEPQTSPVKTGSTVPDKPPEHTASPSAKTGGGTRQVHSEKPSEKPAATIKEKPHQAKTAESSIKTKDAAPPSTARTHSTGKTVRTREMEAQRQAVQQRFQKKKADACSLSSVEIETLPLSAESPTLPVTGTREPISQTNAEQPTVKVKEDIRQVKTVDPSIKTKEVMPSSTERPAVRIRGMEAKSEGSDVDRKAQKIKGQRLTQEKKTRLQKSVAPEGSEPPPETPTAPIIKTREALQQTEVKRPVVKTREAMQEPNMVRPRIKTREAVAASTQPADQRIEAQRKTARKTAVKKRLTKDRSDDKATVQPPVSEDSISSALPKSDVRSDIQTSETTPSTEEATPAVTPENRVEAIQEQGRSKAKKEAGKTTQKRRSQTGKDEIPPDKGTPQEAQWRRSRAKRYPDKRDKSAPPRTEEQTHELSGKSVRSKPWKSVRQRKRTDKPVIKERRLSGNLPSERSGRQLIKSGKLSVKTEQAVRSAGAKTSRQAVEMVRRSRAGIRAFKQAKGAAQKVFSVLEHGIRAIGSAAKSWITAALAGGSAVVIPTLLLLCVIGCLTASPSGLFLFNEDTTGNDAIQNAMVLLNGEFEAKIEQLKLENPADSVVIDNDGKIKNWDDILAIYAVQLSSKGDAVAGTALSEEQMELLRKTLLDMNELSFELESTSGSGSGSAAGTVLHITILSKTADEMADKYGFDESQKKLLEEMKQPGYAELFLSLKGGFDDVSLTPEAMEKLAEVMPSGVNVERRKVVTTAFQLLGKVHYFWGGKSLVLGWDDRWGTPKKVWAAGSKSTGTIRPYGLDCSGFVDWVFYNVSNGEYIIGHGGGAHMQHLYSTDISWSEAIPGDLVFYPEDTHVGIVCGFDESGNIQVIHCASSSNNVVVTGKRGFTSIARPNYYGE